VLHVEPKSADAFDLVSLGEVMLRLDPGEDRIHTTRSFRAWEGGGEYNVARGLRRCFGLRTAIVTALADNPVGRLLEDLMLQGGVDTRYLRWVAYDGMGHAVRNGLNFTERGFGPRAAVGCSDRGHTAVSQLNAGDVPWDRIFAQGEGRAARWLHTGGIFCALSDTTPEVAKEGMRAAKRAGACVSYDLNYRASLWKRHGGKPKAQQANRELLPFVDVLFGNEEDFAAALGFAVEGTDEDYRHLDTSQFRKMILKLVAAFPNVQTVATTLRTAHSASQNGWGAILFHEGAFYETPQTEIEILDRVGGGDSFAAGVLYGLLEGKEPQWCLECGVAHGALAMSTPGDTTTASFAEVQRLMKGGSARIER
jgi:2-dehydro-3-deoxygluconokinase